MFTGITEQVGQIESLDHSETGGRLRISLCGTATAGSAPENDSPIAASTKLGDSISVNGCCLTVVEFTADHFTADLSGETLRKTSFGRSGGALKQGARVNLEQPLTAGQEFGGHFVLGHVDGTGEVVHLRREGESWRYGVQVPEDFARYIVPKGSITIDGISLTVADCRDRIAEIGLREFGLIQFEPQLSAANQGIRTGHDFLRIRLERLLDGKERVVDLAVERLGLG